MERGRSWPGALRIAIGVTVAATVSAAATFVVWLAGLDTAWAVATVVALGAVGGVLVTLRFEDDVAEVAWEPPGRDPPRGIRLAVPVLEASLAACDRLARPRVARRIRALLINERDDRMARATIVRRVRALLIAELRVRGVAPAHQHDDVLVALLGPDARTVLQPDDDHPVTSAAIARCLDAIERLAAAPLPSR